MIAPGAAALAAGLAVWGAWELLGALEEAPSARALGRVLAPLHGAGRAGREPSPAERRRLAVLGTGVLLAAGWIVAGPLLGALLAAGGPMLVGRMVAARRRRWRAGLAAGAPTAARALADALAGGHGVRGAVLEVARAGALPGPAGRELAVVARRLTLGQATEEALEGLRARAQDPAWDTLVAAILLQRDAGGDLARLLRSVAAAREEAVRVEADAHGLTAQARATARLVAGMPFAGLALGELAAPGTLAGLLADPRSRLAAGGAVVLGVTAFAVVGRLAGAEPA